MSNVTCPNCSNPMIYKAQGQWGPFYACTNFPKCRKCISASKIHGSSKVTTAARAATPWTPAVGSPEQCNIWSEIVDGNGHVVVNALAGSGKSFTCRESMHLVQMAAAKLGKQLKVLYLCFNKAIATEFATDAPAGCTVKTINGMGYSICCKALGLTFKNMNKDKVSQLVNELWTPATKEEIDIQKLVINAVEKLVGLCQGYLISPDNAEQLAELVDRHSIELTSDIEEVVWKLLPQVMKLDRERTKSLSFNDQLWFPVVMDLPCEKYDLVYVDEAQDLNPCQHALVMKLLAKGGRMIVVGDDNQAIYGFRGSDTESIRNLAKLLEKTGNVTNLPLTVSRRNAKRIATVAQQYVPEIKAMDNAPEGEVIQTNTELAMDMYTPGDMVVCMMNAPLTHVAYKLMQKGVKVVIRGREIGVGLINLINRLGGKSVNDLLVRLDAWVDAECKKFAGTRREEAITTRINDQADCIRIMSQGCDNLSDLKGSITAIFDNFEADGKPKNCVILSSIHKAKGLESKTVFWLMPEIAFKSKQAWEERQQHNLRYVAVTRAITKLVMVAEKKETKEKKAA